MSNSSRELFANLKALDDASFPKQCPRCQRIYQNLADYIAQTQNDDQSSGIAAEQDERGQTYVAVIRRCTCGTRLLDHFNDRRDNSERGQKRRRAFDKVVEHLVQQGVEREQARNELLKHMHGQSSKLLEQFGIFSK